MTLVILAAGLGSRFGGLKQITPVGPNGEFIIDYSIYDAIKAGFNKVVFIIKEENYELFRTTIGKRVENKIDVEYVFQSNDTLPIDIKIPEERGAKPLGTAHAIYCCKDTVTEPFLVINADDFYGYDAYAKAIEFIKNNTDDHNYALIGYKVINTLSEHGFVKRGVITTDGNQLVSITESKVELINDELVAEPLSGKPKFIVPKDGKAAVNLFVFYPNIFNYLEQDLIKFLQTEDLTKEEIYLPMQVFEHTKTHDITCEVIDTDAVWKGITYADDLDSFKAFIKDEIERGVYPVDL